MRSLIAGIVLLAASGGAFAQTLACNPQAPRADPGTGFVPFGAAEQALARGGNSGPAWEWALGTDTESGQKVQGSLDWVSGRSYAWTLSYSGAGAATLEIRDAGVLVLSLNYPSGMDAGNGLELQVATNPSIGPDITMAASVTTIMGQAASGSVSQSGNNQASAQRLYFYYPPMLQGFTAKGTVSLTFARLPTGSRVDFKVRSGTLPCTNSAPMVSVSAPTAGRLLQAGSAVTVSANAQDSDGSIVQVEFFANSVSIGTDNAAPYAVQWTPAAGPASLTARATDNAGNQTTSVAVGVTVNAPPTVSITSPAANATFTAPASVPITVSAQDADGSISRVEFYANASLIATLTATPYAFNWTNVSAGPYALTARVLDNNNGEAMSNSVPITVNAGVAQLYFMHPDHLNTPRLVANATGTTVWRWDQAEPFGNNTADENPSGLGAFDLPLRLPGQRYDKETNLHYNAARNYDASIGRYEESDLIGLKGGLNTYAYAYSDPLRFTDPSGLAVWLCIRSVSFNFGNHSYFYDDKTRQCCGYPGWNRDHPLQACPDRGRGPGVDSCTLISSNDDDAERLFTCCQKNANPYTYFPTWNDCQNLTDDCIREIGMAPPQTPSTGRWMGCDTCWRRP